ncbi:MAG TPA: hypothetical protein VFF98_17210 [Novosphingobium sp.]|nr:hypothetical protein [Novosphingobium sp.]
MRAVEKALRTVERLAGADASMVRWGARPWASPTFSGYLVEFDLQLQTAPGQVRPWDMGQGMRAFATMLVQLPERFADHYLVDSEIVSGEQVGDGPVLLRGKLLLLAV